MRIFNTCFEMQQIHQLLAVEQKYNWLNSLILFYSASLNWLPFALTQARKRLRKLTTDFLIASCGSSFHIINILFAKQTIFTDYNDYTVQF